MLVFDFASVKRLVEKTVCERMCTVLWWMGSYTQLLLHFSIVFLTWLADWSAYSDRDFFV